MSELFVTVEGDGPLVLFIHGSAADHTTWSIQRASLASKLRLLLYDRRGTGQSPAAIPERLSVEAHAEDAAALIRKHASAPIIACGSSFGAVVLLELLKTQPELIAGAVLIEPPLASTDEHALLARGFLQRFDDVAAEQGGPAAGEFFLRSVLGDDAFERMPKPFRERSTALWRSIRDDTVALSSYRVNYPALKAVTTPTLLCAGERSAQFFRPTVEALHRALGNASVELFSNAGHMLHAEAHRRFNARLTDFVRAHAPSRSRS